MSSTPSLAAAQYRDAEPVESYRAVSTLAVVSLVLGVMSPLAVLDEALLIVPVAASMIGVIALRQIAARDGELVGRGLAKIGITLAIVSGAGGWSVRAYQESVEVPPGYQRVLFEQLQPDPSVSATMIPPSAMRLDGQRVYIKGYILPSRETQGLKQFILVWTTGDCCFGGSPPITHMIEVAMTGELSLNYTTRPQRLAGTFHVAPARAADGKQVIYRLDADWLP